MTLRQKESLLNNLYKLGTSEWLMQKKSEHTKNELVNSVASPLLLSWGECSPRVNPSALKNNPQGIAARSKSWAGYNIAHKNERRNVVSRCGAKVTEQSQLKHRNDPDVKTLKRSKQIERKKMKEFTMMMME